MDIIFLAQAFHHADKPLCLLVKCDRILKKGGRIILLGEHFIGKKLHLRKMLSVLVKQKKFYTDFYKLFEPDEKPGDHYYRRSDY